jgi:hypothetical protein
LTVGGSVRKLDLQRTSFLFAGINTMPRVEELKQAVSSLPPEEYRQFRDWFMERDWALWDREVEEDVASGKLDFLIKEVEEERRLGKTKPLNPDDL